MWDFLKRWLGAAPREAQPVPEMAEMPLMRLPISPEPEHLLARLLGWEVHRAIADPNLLYDPEGEFDPPEFLRWVQHPHCGLTQVGEDGTFPACVHSAEHQGFHVGLIRLVRQGAGYSPRFVAGPRRVCALGEAAVAADELLRRFHPRVRVPAPVRVAPA